MTDEPDAAGGFAADPPTVANLVRSPHQGRPLLPLLLSVLPLAIAAIGIVLGGLLLPQQHPHALALADRLLSWDGRIYFVIMRNGYAWNPVQGLVLHHHQSIAFFPLQVLIDRLVVALSGSPAPLPILGVTCAFGVASIFAFHSLSRRLLPARAAAWATALFALWPASCFYVMGYPTGLISLCVIAALEAHLRERYWLSAVWCGIGTAAAPTVAFVVLALGIDRALATRRAGVTLPRLAELAGWALVSISGLLGFMLYQQIRFHDMFAFTEAAVAWGAAPAFPARFGRLLDWRWYVQQPDAGLDEIRKGLALWRHGARASPAMVWIEQGVQRWLNAASMIVVVTGLVLATMDLRGRARVVPLAGWSVLAGYAWFIFTTDQNMLTVPRLLFPAVALFLGLGSRLARAPAVVAGVAVGLLALAAAMEVAFAVSGYWVT